MEKNRLLFLMSIAMLGLSSCGGAPAQSSAVSSVVVSSQPSSAAVSSSVNASSSQEETSSEEAPTEYSITYELDGGTNDPSNPSSYVKGSEFPLASPTKTGYEFVGWYDRNGRVIAGIKPGMALDLRLFARWTAKQNNLSVTSEDPSKGTVSITKGSGYSDEEVTVVATPAIACDFEGWYRDGKRVSTSASYTFAMPAGDCSLTARFSYNLTLAVSYGIVPKFSADGKTVTYGLYPQKNVNDSTLVSALNKLSKPEANGWYLYDGAFYAKTVATPLDAKRKFDNGTSIVAGTTYWFACKAIEWEVLAQENEGYYLLSSVLLDTHCYHSSQQPQTIDGYKVYPNDYGHSDIRSWLNGAFHDSAFAFDDAELLVTAVDNSASTTDSKSNPWACDDTQDKVFLPSYRDYLDADYGFTTDKSPTFTRYCKTTDWTRARGAYYSEKHYPFNGSYWMRSPDAQRDGSYTSWLVSYDGGIGFDDVDYAADAVRPAVTLKMSAKDVATPPLLRLSD